MSGSGLGGSTRQAAPAEWDKAGLTLVAGRDLMLCRHLVDCIETRCDRPGEQWFQGLWVSRGGEVLAETNSVYGSRREALLAAAKHLEVV